MVEKQKINSMDINTDDFSEILKKYNAYFLITLGGPIIKNKIIKSVNGLALNQHAGHSPEYKGSKTIEWALYNRDLRYLSNVCTSHHNCCRWGANNKTFKYLYSSR